MQKHNFFDVAKHIGMLIERCFHTSLKVKTVWLFSLLRRSRPPSETVKGRICGGRLLHSTERSKLHHVEAKEEKNRSKKA